VVFRVTRGLHPQDPRATARRAIGTRSIPFSLLTQGESLPMARPLPNLALFQISGSLLQRMRPFGFLTTALWLDRRDAASLLPSGVRDTDGDHRASSRWQCVRSTCNRNDLSAQETREMRCRTITWGAHAIELPRKVCPFCKNTESR
jgi:hypothetical protein